MNHDFHESLPLRVYECWNQGTPRLLDDNDLHLGVFYEQDEFCPPFRDGDDFRLPQQRNIQQRQQRRSGYSSREEKDFRFNYQANNWDQSNKEFKLKMDSPSFYGRLHIEDFLDWIHTVENFFDYSNI